MRWTLLEAVGVVCLTAFAVCIWPPLGLAVAGVACIVIAFVGDSQAATSDDDEARP